MNAMLAYAILALVALQRVAELIYASSNVRALRARGGVEYGRSHYPVLVALHVSWLIAIGLAVGPNTTIYWLPLALFVLLQAMRIWVLATLRGYWTTRLITVPGAPLVQTGPYRYLRHPNYVVVVGEVAALPLVFGQTLNAVIFSAVNLAVLGWRIKVENAALSPRRQQGSSQGS